VVLWGISGPTREEVVLVVLGEVVVSCLPLDPRFADLNPAEPMDF
jgi:hypothetical protein